MWDLHKLEVLKNVNLSEYFWEGLGINGGKLPDNILLREWLGILAVLGYCIYGPILLRKKLSGLYEKMGPERFYLLVMLLLTMASLPIKMFLRWTINLKYIVAIPEWFFNI